MKTTNTTEKKMMRKPYVRTAPLKPLSQRLREKTIVVEGECWGWTGSINSSGYGSIYVDGKVESASRASWIVHRGEIPIGAHVLHCCDNRSCSNPSHLFLGDNRINVEDRAIKGRSRGAEGAKNRNARLSEEDVIAIRSIYRGNKIGTTELGASFGITRDHTKKILLKKAWKNAS